MRAGLSPSRALISTGRWPGSRRSPKPSHTSAPCATAPAPPSPRCQTSTAHRICWLRGRVRTPSSKSWTWTKSVLSAAPLTPTVAPASSLLATNARRLWIMAPTTATPATPSLAARCAARAAVRPRPSASWRSRYAAALPPSCRATSPGKPPRRPFGRPTLRTCSTPVSATPACVRCARNGSVRNLTRSRAGGALWRLLYRRGQRPTPCTPGAGNLRQLVLRPHGRLYTGTTTSRSTLWDALPRR